ncbi:MAG: AAA family ATPase, partial [Planctomycetes bacterium]|nr:AAA family ATPase [Planctomycetota bacterium]
LLYGPPGTGKSHLIQCILAQWRRSGSAFECRETTAREFDQAFREALKSRQTDRFARRYSDPDVLVCEDLHQLSGRHEAQWQLLHCLDELLQGGRRVLLTSRVPPGQLSRFLPKLVNRLHGGHCLPMDLPSYAGRLLFLRLLASSLQIALPADVAELLARPLGSSLGDLAEQIRRLDAASRAAKVPITRELTLSTLDSLSSESPPSLAKIARAVSAEFGVPVEQLRSQSRVRKLVRSRQVAIYLSRVLGQQPYSKIASYFGLNNHSTAVHSVRRVEKLLQTDAVLRSRVANAETALRSR